MKKYMNKQVSKCKDKFTHVLEKIIAEFLFNLPVGKGFMFVCTCDSKSRVKIKSQ